MKRVFVTGGTGMIGVAFINACIEQNIEVYALVRPGSKHAGRLPAVPLVHIVNGNLENMDSTDWQSVPKCDAFYHFGWLGTTKDVRNDVSLQERNIRITLQAVATADKLGCRAFIGAGSQAEYGIHKDEKTGPGTPADPVVPYGIAKLAAGKLAGIQALQLSMNFVWIRVFSVYGPYEMPGTLTRTLIPKMLDNASCGLTEGIQRWDYLYSDDSGKAFLKAGEKACDEKQYSRVFCLGSGEKRNLRSYVEEMKTALHSDSELEFGKIPYLNGVPAGICADIADLEQETGWKPETSFVEGILKEAEWIMKEEA